MAQDQKQEAIITAAIKRFTHFGVTKTAMAEMSDWMFAFVDERRMFKRGQIVILQLNYYRPISRRLGSHCLIVRPDF